MQWSPISSLLSLVNRDKSNTVKFESLTPLSMMISVTESSRDTSSSTLLTVAFGLCLGRLGCSANAPLSTDHSSHTRPSWILNIPVGEECKHIESHVIEIGHVYSSFQSGWKLLSRMRWRAHQNVETYFVASATLRFPVSDVSLGKSSLSIHTHFITSHDECVWF